MNSAQLMRGGAACAARLLLLCAPSIIQACPTPTERDALLATLDRSIEAHAGIDPALQSLLDASGSCAAADEAQLLADIAHVLRRAGDSPRLLAIERSRVEVARRAKLTAHEADARLQIALLSVASAELDTAIAQFDLALDAYRRAGDLAGQARIHTELSRVERRRGDYLAALRFELAGLDLRRQLDPPPDLWRSLLNLAVLYEQIELYDEARRHFAAALTEAERGGDETQIADVLNGYAGFLNDFGGEASHRALPMAERALQIHRRGGSLSRVASCLLQVGRAHLGLGHLEAAKQALDETLSMAGQGGFDGLRAHASFRLGELELKRGRVDEALQLIERARVEYEVQGNRHRLVKVQGMLEHVHELRGDALASARAGREHYRLRNELLGAKSTARLGELLTNFALADSERRNDRLQQENAVHTLRLESERRLRHAGYLIAAIVICALALLGWRHAAVRRLYKLLQEGKYEAEAQRAALSAANARLTHLNRIDTLTGLASRAFGLERLAALLTHARARGTTPALLLFDLDHFKAINDRFGHLAGDQVLMAVADTLSSQLPEDAMAVRAGGEEFMVVMEHADHARAQMLADAIRRRVRDLAVDVGPQRVHITLSGGIAHASIENETSVRELFAAADHALYEAKRAGRDRIVSDAPGP